MIRFKIIIFLICIIFSGCKTTKFENRTIYGMIYDENNEPISAATIKIANEVEISDFYGHFNFDLKSNMNEYEAEISKPGFISKKINFHAGNSSQIMHIKMESFLSVLNEAASCLENKDAEKCISLLDKINGTDSCEQIIFIRAVAYYRMGDFEKAYSSLKGIDNYENKLYVMKFMNIILKELDCNEQ